MFCILFYVLLAESHTAADNLNVLFFENKKRLGLDDHHNLALDKGCGAGGHSGKGPGRILFLFRKSFFENACGKTLSHYNKTIL